jgi:predicted RND superfamily exporter protein
MSDSITDSIDRITSSVPVVGGAIGTVINVIGGLFNQGEQATKSDIEISDALRPLLKKWTDFQIASHPEDKIGLLEWENNFNASLGSSNALHNFMLVHKNMSDAKYQKPPMELEWYKAWNSLAVASGVPSNQISIPAGTKDSFINSGTSAVTDVINKVTGQSLSSMNIIIIIVMIGTLSYLFFKGNK